MANDADFVAHCQELLAQPGQPVRVRRMFGGHGLYLGEHFIAILMNDVLYLKVDGQTQATFEAEGSRPFEYTVRDGQRGVLAYWQAPDEAMDSPALMRPWAQQALGAALRAAQARAKRPTKPRTAPRTASGKAPAAAAAKSAPRRRSGA